MRRARGWWLLPLAGACSGDSAFDFELVPDPNLATDAQLAAQLSTLVFVLDSPTGLYRPGEEQSDERFQIKDADANPDDLELVITLEVAGDRLPTLRVERGGLPDEPLDVRVLGLPLSGGSVPIAQGTLRGLRFSDEAQTIALPFDLRDEVLPPRVESILPADGSDLPGCRLSSIVLVFSRPVDASSLAEQGAILVEPATDVTSVTLSDEGLVATLTTSGLESQSGSLSYRVIVGSTVVDLEGHAFDQVPSDDGNQAYEAELHHPCVPPPTMPDMPCGETFCLSSPRIACIDDKCTFTSCTEVCAEGLVCDAIHDRCREDCRTGDAVSACAEGSTCDADTGLCALID